MNNNGAELTESVHFKLSLLEEVIVVEKRIFRPKKYLVSGYKCVIST